MSRRLTGLEPAIAPQRVNANPRPHHIESHRRPCAVPGAIDDESESAEDVHPLVNRRARLNLPERQQTITAEDEQSCRPSGQVDKGLERHAPPCGLGACLTNDRRHEGAPQRADFCDRNATHSGYYVSETIAEIYRCGAAAVGASLVRQVPRDQMDFASNSSTFT